MRVATGFRGFGSAPVQQAELRVQTNVSADARLAMCEENIRRLAAELESRTTQLTAAVNSLAQQNRQLMGQNVSLAKALQAVTAGVRVGYGPMPSYPAMPGQPVNVGIPTRALRPSDVTLVDGAQGAPRAQIDPAGAQAANGRTMSISDWENMMMNSGDDDA